MQSPLATYSWDAGMVFNKITQPHGEELLLEINRAGIHGTKTLKTGALSAIYQTLMVLQITLALCVAFSTKLHRPSAWEFGT